MRVFKKQIESIPYVKSPYKCVILKTGNKQVVIKHFNKMKINLASSGINRYSEDDGLLLRNVSCVEGSKNGNSFNIRI